MRRFLFVTYCTGVSQGQAMIGVYKRGLRIALKLAERGHEVFFFCSGRENYRDALTARGEEELRFVDIPHGHAAYYGAILNRAVFCERISQIDPDVVVIGEAPLAGPLLEASLAAAELEIPVVLLDNAYQPFFVEGLCRNHAGLFDAIVLTGPSALHLQPAPEWLLQVPPYIQADTAAATRLLEEELDLSAERFVVVLAYDPKVAVLAASLLAKTEDLDVSAVFISPDPDETSGALSGLSTDLARRVRVVRPQSEGILFGLIECARVAVVKMGFMQVTEALSLRTPVIGLHYPSGFSADLLPTVCQPFVSMPSDTGGTPDSVAAMRRFVALSPDALSVIHDGQFDAASQAAAFLESTSTSPRPDISQATTEIGFSVERLQTALATIEGREDIKVLWARSSSLRTLPTQRLFTMLCSYAVNGSTRCTRLWGRLFASAADVEDEVERGAQDLPQREILYASPDARLLIEKDLGEAVLPSHQQCEEECSRKGTFAVWKSQFSPDAGAELTWRTV